MRYFDMQRENILPRHYISGENHFYLGRRHMLKVREDAKNTPKVKLLKGVLEVQVRKTNPEKTKAMIFGWYRVRAREVFDRRLEDVVSKTLWINESPLYGFFLCKHNGEAARREDN